MEYREVGLQVAAPRGGLGVHAWKEENGSLRNNETAAERCIKYPSAAGKRGLSWVAKGAAGRAASPMCGGLGRAGAPVQQACGAGSDHHWMALADCLQECVILGGLQIKIRTIVRQELGLRPLEPVARAQVEGQEPPAAGWREGRDRGWVSGAQASRRAGMP